MNRPLLPYYAAALVAAVVGTAAWYDLRTTMLVNRGIGHDIRQKFDEHDANVRDILDRLARLEGK